MRREKVGHGWRSLGVPVAGWSGRDTIAAMTQTGSTPVTLERPARPAGAARRAAPRRARRGRPRRRLWRWTLARPKDEAGPARLVRAALAADAGTELPFATIDRLRPADRQQPLHEHRPRAPPARDRLDVGRDGVAADRGQPRGQAAAAHPRVRDARRRRVEFKTHALNEPRGPRCSGSGRPSRASSATTWSCRTARSATPPTTASSSRSGRPSRPGSSAGSADDRGEAARSPTDPDRRLPHRRRTVPDRDRRRPRARRRDGPRATAVGAWPRSTTSRPAHQRAARPRRHVRRFVTPPNDEAPTSASSSSTTRATRPRAATARSRS